MLCAYNMTMNINVTLHQVHQMLFFNRFDERQSFLYCTINDVFVHLMKTLTIHASLLIQFLLTNPSGSDAPEQLLCRSTITKCHPVQVNLPFFFFFFLGFTSQYYPFFFFFFAAKLYYTLYKLCHLFDTLFICISKNLSL